MGIGAITTVLTLVTNKPYLGWPRHTWDPMILGALLFGVALSLRRSLASGSDRIRHGFTAERLSARDKRWIDTSAAALGFLSAHAGTHATHATESKPHFGGGESGGGGASDNF